MKPLYVCVFVVNYCMKYSMVQAELYITHSVYNIGFVCVL